jgi:hypothetical protein
MGRDRERWVKHDARPQRAVEMVVDVRGVMLRNRETGQELAEQLRTMT